MRAVMAIVNNVHGAKIQQIYTAAHYESKCFAGHPAIAQSKGFSDSNAFSSHTRPPFKVTDAILSICHHRGPERS